MAAALHLLWYESRQPCTTAHAPTSAKWLVSGDSTDLIRCCFVVIKGWRFWGEGEGRGDGSVFSLETPVEVVPSRKALARIGNYWPCT